MSYYGYTSDYIAYQYISSDLSYILNYEVDYQDGSTYYSRLPTDYTSSVGTFSSLSYYNPSYNDVYTQRDVDYYNGGSNYDTNYNINYQYYATYYSSDFRYGYYAGRYSLTTPYGFYSSSDYDGYRSGSYYTPTGST